MTSQAHATKASAAAPVVTKAVLRAADHLRVPNSVLAKVIGVSEPTLSRMRTKDLLLSERGKEFELALLFIRLYRSLDSIVGGESEIAAAWLRNDNRALGGAPLEHIQTIPGLMNVIAYLDSRRAVV
ncbi:MbcA/ParS/Xre antitoxin family protein [Azospirillum sp. TSO35-2]|uniref:MbcA/ParS/Xre antitoxin family protein n=1 Tax=Azospirillum sp. TSO35-2 TaxID=716796 RepID=UPI000D60562B|nr:MbcA/ParS/Xre antitoxin family protein [Azospirillum sp. TSO35-2]PWC30990.1 transcriptional regulator, XRE family protein [Azospirillum sp. TSO35-2]